MVSPSCRSGNAGFIRAGTVAVKTSNGKSPRRDRGLFFWHYRQTMPVVVWILISCYLRFCRVSKSVLGHMEPFVTTLQVAEFLGMSPRTINRMAKEGRIPAHPVSGTARRTWRFRLSEVEKHFASGSPTITVEDGRPNPAER
jgi:excisionase family DNA binding protein